MLFCEHMTRFSDRVSASSATEPYRRGILRSSSLRDVVR